MAYGQDTHQDAPVVKSARKARGAEPGPSVRNVLVLSTAAVVVALGALYYVFFMT